MLQITWDYKINMTYLTLGVYTLKKKRHKLKSKNSVIKIKNFRKNKTF